MTSSAGLQAEAEARPVRAPELDMWTEEGRCGREIADPEPERGSGAQAAERNARPAGRLPGEEAPRPNRHQRVEAGEFGTRVFAHGSRFILKSHYI